MKISPYILPGLIDPEANNKDRAALLIQAVSQALGVSFKAMASPNRCREYMEARHIAISLLRQQTRMTTMEIGRLFHRDHSTILYAVNNVRTLISSDKRFKEKADKVNELLESPAYKF